MVDVIIDQKMELHALKEAFILEFFEKRGFFMFTGMVFFAEGELFLAFDEEFSVREKVAEEIAKAMETFFL